MKYITGILQLLISTFLLYISIFAISILNAVALALGATIFGNLGLLFYPIFFGLLTATAVLLLCLKGKALRIVAYINMALCLIFIAITIVHVQAYLHLVLAVLALLNLFTGAHALKAI